MTGTAPESGDTQAEVVVEIQKICEKTDQPAEIWEELESKGIDVTPGVVHQALNEAKDHDPHAPKKPFDPKPFLGIGTGLTAADIEVLAALADKAGGAEALVRVLTAMQHIGN